MRKNQSGFTLLELLTGIGIIAISGLGVAGLSTLVGQNYTQTSARHTVDNFKLKLQTLIESPEAWSLTVQQNQDLTMGCLANGTDCKVTGSGQEPQAFKVYDLDNVLFYASDVATAGFNYQGQACNDFSLESTTCPFRYDLTWRALCPPTGSCIAPIISVTGTLRITNQLKYKNQILEPNFTILRSYSTNTIERSCMSLGGRYNVTTNQCVRSSTSQMCTAGQMLVGISINGAPECKPMFTGLCTGTTIVVGFDPTTGTPICREPTDQIPGLAPELFPIQCAFFGKSDGALWYVPNGEVTHSYKCSDNERHYQKIFGLESQMKCASGFVVPTGRTRETDTGRTVGNCLMTLCPDGKSVGDLYWTSQGQSNERFTCYGSDPAIERPVRFEVEAQFMCTVYGESSTGRIRKNELSRGTCPALTTSFTHTYNIGAGQQRASGKILFIVDNSNSMAGAQSNLSSGVDTFLSEFVNADIEVKVLNTSDPGHTTSGFSTGISYVDSAGTVTTSYGSYPHNTTLTRNEFNRMKSAHKYVLANTATPAQLSTFRNSVKTAILNGGGASAAQAIAGDTTESGLCSALMALYENGPNRFFKPGDVGGIIFLTDDNDYSTWNNTINSCRNFLSRNTVVKKKTRYTVSHYRYKYQYSTIVGTDGVPTVKTFYTNLKANETGASGTACAPEVVTAIAASKGISESDLLPFANGAKCVIENANTTVDFNPHTDNRCSVPFTEGTLFTDLEAYFARPASNLRVRATQGAGSYCVQQQVSTESIGSTINYGFKSLADPRSLYTKTLPRAIFDRGIELFGERGFYVSNIVATSACPPTTTPPQQESTKYMAIANFFSLTGHANNFPVCSTNYAGALKPLSDGLLESINNSIIFSHVANENVSAIEVVRGGSTINLNASQYEVFGDRIDFIGFNLLANDIVRVTVTATLSD